jgi:hypothetical protein
MNEMDNVSFLADFIDVPDTPEETYRLALESIFRWTVRRDELDDSQIVLAIKRVAKYALETY